MSKEYLQQPIIPVGAVDANLGIFLEDFNRAKRGAAAGTGSDYHVRLRPDAGLRGDLGLEIQTKGTTPASNDYASYTEKFGTALSQYMEVSMSVMFPSVANAFTFEIVISVPSGKDTHGLQFGARIIQSSGNIDVLTGSNAYTNVDTVAQLAADDWNIITVGIDRINQTYETLRWNQESFDPASNTPYDEGSNDNTQQFVAKITANSANQVSAYIDTIIVRSQLS